MSKFTQTNHGNARGTQIIPKGREADFVQVQVGEGGRSRRIVLEDDDVDVQVVNSGEVKFQSAQDKPTKTTFCAAQLRWHLVPGTRDEDDVQVIVCG